MNTTDIIIAAAIIGGIGIIIGVLLGVAAKVFHVEVDKKEEMIRGLLPGSNCGGCGFAGCDALAKAIAKGESEASACPVGGAAVAEAIAGILGTEVSVEQQVAFVMCAGTCEHAKEKYQYTGNMSCVEANYVPGGGPNACSYGCLGYGSCVSVCQFDAIHIINGVAQVDKESCVACGKCIEICPKNLIELVPYTAETLVQCSSKDKGKDVKAVCSIGCIACKICEKACEFDAVKVENNLSKIDYLKCTDCRKCAESCPTKVIF